MKLVHEGGYSAEERRLYRPVVYTNSIQSMNAILDAMVLLDIAFADQRLESYAQTCKQQPERIENESLPEAIGTAISILWRDPGVQECFQRSREYQLNDSAR